MRLLLLTLLVSPVLCNGQYLQQMKGNVIDKESKAVIAGAIICITDLNPSLTTESDSNGEYLIKGIPVGKHDVTVSHISYKPQLFMNVLVTSAKEVILPVEMVESSISINEVVIFGKQQHINEMAIVGSRTFDVQETERYAGSRTDPARMASNFAGVQGGDDSRNDIIIRGNSPQGVLWRLEGIDIPNPNHFAIVGTTGGPASMLNNKTLANSDFFTGAFPAEYGNAVAGIFDLRLRSGNNDRYEFTGQFGFLGTEIVAEGPISKKSGSSFLFTYRYSTLKIFNAINIPIGTTSIPNYQDATFKMNFPVGKKANISVFGIGGLSKIDLMVSTLAEPEPQLYGESDRDQYFSSNTGVLGASFSHTFNVTTYLKLTIAETASDIEGVNDKVFRDANFKVDSLKRILGYRFMTATTVAHWSINKEIAAKHNIKAGIINNYYHLNLQDSTREYPTSRQDWQVREDFKGGTNLAQVYIQHKYRPSDVLTVIAGLHSQYLTLNKAASVEPRIAVKWTVNNNSVFTAGYGLHSQMQQLYQYYAYQPGTRNKVNENISFTRSHHVILGYNQQVPHNAHIHFETFYQYLFNVPIETRAGSSYSALNQGATFTRDFPDVLVNKGTGYNYGAELTIKKKFSQGFYVLFTGSVFNSKAKGNDGLYRSTDYNSGHTVNLLGGYEKKLGRNSTFISGLKGTYLGGKRYSPADIAASNMHGNLVVTDSLRNTLQFEPYFRADVKVGVRVNTRKVTHELGLDLINITGTKNVMSLVYSSDLAATGAADPFYYQYQLGFLPIFYYRIDFAIRQPENMKN